MRLLLRPLNILLIAGPFAYVSERSGWGEGATFILAALAIIPLAGLIAGFTDILADRLGDKVGGLLEATFGNLAFLILGFLALRQGPALIPVVKASIAGAIISNTLFVLGLAFVLGNWRNIRQRFSVDLSTNYAKLLVLAVVALVLPAIAVNAGVNNSTSEEISAVVAIVLITLYVLYIMFDLFHVKDLVYHDRLQAVTQPQSEPINAENAPIAEYRAERDKESHPQQRGGLLQARRGLERDTTISPWIAVVGLAVVTVATVAVSELLVSVTEIVTHSREPLRIGSLQLGTFDVTPVFVGLVILPLIGTAAEHISAIRSALDGRAEVTIAVTAGAAIQIALLAAPLFVLANFIFNGSPMSLVFTPIEIAVFGLATFLFYLVTEDGEGTWFEGAQLLAFYIIFAGTAFFLPK